jgi:hypothetical protein
MRMPSSQKVNKDRGERLGNIIERTVLHRLTHAPRW